MNRSNQCLEHVNPQFNLKLFDSVFKLQFGYFIFNTWFKYKNESP